MTDALNNVIGHYCFNLNGRLVYREGERFRLGQSTYNTLTEVREAIEDQRKKFQHKIINDQALPL